MAEVPIELPTGRVVGKFIFEVQDNNDPGEDPQLVPVTGDIIIKSAIDNLTIFDQSLGKFVTFRGPHKAIIDSEGELATPDPITGEPMYTGMSLWSNDSDKLSVKGWTYTATFNLKTADGKALNLQPATFTLATGQEVDLADVIKVPATPGYGLPQAEGAALRAEAAVSETITGATVVGDDLVMTRRNGVEFTAGHVRGATGGPGPKGDPGPSGVSNTDQFYQVSETAGRTVSVWDYINSRYQLVYGDTGWRNVLSWAPPGKAYTFSKLEVRRVGSTVYLRFENATGDIGTMVTPPSGFRINSTTINYWQTIMSSSGAIKQLRGNVYGFVIAGVVASDVFSAYVTYETSDPWPTSLPGVAA